MQPNLKSPGIKRLKLKCDTPLSTSTFKFNWRHCATAAPRVSTVGALRQFPAPVAARTLVTSSMKSLRASSAEPSAASSIVSLRAASSPTRPASAGGWRQKAAQEVGAYTHPLFGLT